MEDLNSRFFHIQYQSPAYQYFPFYLLFLGFVFHFLDPKDAPYFPVGKTKHLKVQTNPLSTVMKSDNSVSTPTSSYSAP